MVTKSAVVEDDAALTRLQLLARKKAQENAQLQMILSSNSHLKSSAHPTSPMDSLTSRSWLIKPQGSFMMFWDMFTVAFLLFTAIVTPFEVAFLETDLNSALFWINRAVDLFFLCDLVRNFFTPYLDPYSGSWVTSHRKIALNYFRFWFYIDFVSVLPFDVVGVVISSADVQKYKALRLLRLLRLIRLIRLLKVSRIVERWSPLIPIRYAWASLIRFALGMLMIAHWIACLMGMIPWLEGTTRADVAENATAVNWQIAYFENTLSYTNYSLWTVYLGGFYFASMTLTTIGYGDVIPKTDVERGIVILIMLVGGGSYAYAIGNVFTIISSMDTLTSDFRNTMDDLNQFMQEVNLPIALRVKVRKYFHFTLYHKRAVNNAELMKTLSPSLQNASAYVANHAWVDQIPFLQHLRDDGDLAFVANLAGKFTQRPHAPLERVIELGAPLQAMFVVERGAVVLHTTDNPMDASVKDIKVGVHMFVQETIPEHVRAELVTGLCFGHEIVYAIDDKQGPLAQYHATTVTYCEIHFVSLQDFFDTLHKFPSTRDKLKRYALRRSWTRFKTDSVITKRQSVVDPVLLQMDVDKLKGELEVLQREIKEKDARVRKMMEE